MASPTKSLTKYLQAVGRSARLKTEDYVKRFGQNALIIDVVDSTTRHNLVNAWELDKGKSPEDRVFISKEKRDKLLEERKAKLEHERKEDEKVTLLAIPKLHISKSIRMQEEATEKQLETIAKWGYDVENKHYSKLMVSQIFAQQPASAKQVSLLKYHKFETLGKVITIGEVQACMELINAKQKA